MKKISGKCYLDTNVLVYFNLKQSPKHPQAVFLLKNLVKHKVQLYISSLVIDEFLNALVRSFRFYRKKLDFGVLREVLKNTLALPDLKIVNPPLVKGAHQKVVSFMEKFNLRPRDAYHLLTMQTNNIQFFATFDDDFRGVFRKKVISPVKP